MTKFEDLSKEDQLKYTDFIYNKIVDEAKDEGFIDPRSALINFIEIATSLDLNVKVPLDKSIAQSILSGLITKGLLYQVPTTGKKIKYAFNKAGKEAALADAGYGDNEKTIDEKIKEAIEVFQKTRKIKDLPLALKIKALDNQQIIYGYEDENIILDGAFDFSESIEGGIFWANINNLQWLNPEVINIIGSKEGFFEKPKVLQNIEEKISEAKEKFIKTLKIADLPIGLKNRALANQIIQKNKPNEDILLNESHRLGNFLWSDSLEGGDFWQDIFNGNWSSEDVLDVTGSKEAFFEDKSTSSTPTTSTGNIDLRNTKIRINSPEESRIFQEFAFENGAKWSSGSKKVAETDAKFLFLNDLNTFTFSDFEDTFVKDKGREITLEELGLDVKSVTERVRLLTQDEIEEYFNTDGKFVDSKTRRLALGIDPKYKAYLIYNKRFNNYGIEIVDLLDQIVAYSGPWVSYKPDEINKFLRYNSGILMDMLTNDRPIFDALHNVLDVLRKKYEPDAKPTTVTSVTPEPTTTKGTKEWRIKTKEELEKEFGSNFRVETNMNAKGKMDWLFGKNLYEVTGLNDDEIQNSLDKGISITTKPELDPDNLGIWILKDILITKKPLQPLQKDYTLPIETIPEKLSFKPKWEPNKGGVRQSPTQSAGDLYDRYDSLESHKKELFNTLFKGNDGNWWKLNERSNTWIWVKADVAKTPSTSTTTTTPVKKEWTPKDLVGKKLLFTNSGKKYLVEEFTRNNPKNKEYKLRDLTSPATPQVTYKISMSLVEKWLNGQTAYSAKIIEDEPSNKDYSTWSQSQLINKRKEISDALIAFEEDDPEYKELKNELDVIDTFID